MHEIRGLFVWEVCGALLACAASIPACGDYSAASETDTATASNQPGASASGSAATSSVDNQPARPSEPRGSGGSSPGRDGVPGDELPVAGGDAGVPACAGDSDSDGVADCDDGCPEDALKSSPGVCGCAVPDTDLDADGTLDCQEQCPNDPGKLMPGVCGCGRPDVDTDRDGTLDCNDGCPYDGALQAPGTCGCGAPANLPLCLRHRYSFDGTGSVATDSAGNDDGTVVNATLNGDGRLVLLGGVSDQYVNLPPNLISRLGASATIEAWLNWTGAGAPWQRIFDFGSSELGPGQQGAGVTYLFVTPSNTINTHVRAAFTNAGPPEERTVNGPTPLPFGVASHIALVIDGVAQTLALYQDGKLLDAPAPTVDTKLALLNDVNNWIGRSQFVVDEEFQGTIDELRIYSAARTAEQIAAEFTAGPDTLPAR